eukprot:10100968-Lingulodinium_polyedra.AAC.1
MLRVPDPGPVVPEPRLGSVPLPGALAASDELLEVARDASEAVRATELSGRPGCGNRDDTGLGVMDPRQSPAPG